MSRATPQVFGVGFHEGGVSIDYALPTDMRVEGSVVRMCSLQVATDRPDYAEDIEALQRSVVALLNNALDDFYESDPHKPEVEVEGSEDDEGGMGRRPEAMD